MIRYLLTLSLFTVAFQSCLFSQPTDMKTYNGEWEAAIHPQVFSHELTFTRQTKDKWRVEMANNQPFYDQTRRSTGEGDVVEIRLDEHLHFTGEISNDGKVLAGFLQSMDTRFRLTLHQAGKDKFTGQWNSFYVAEIQPAMLYLWMGGEDDGCFEAYPTLPDDRYRGTYATDFSKKGDEISFVDQRGGYRFKGTLGKDEILMDLYIHCGGKGHLLFPGIYPFSG